MIQRLLSDVAKITSDADHLPLLQHVLARTWEAACAREEADGKRQLPAEILWFDLEHAVDPRSQRAPGWLHEQDLVNTLRISLENWAEAVYRDRNRSPECQALIDVVLRRLAFKDPNNGLYSQQRVDVDDPNLFEGVAQPRQKLRDLLERGFLDSVNYLFWDMENPDRVTLKVSHESFIRGWAHFRALVDAEADRFDEFVAVLRKCALWKVDEKPELLLEASELTRLEASGLTPVFESRDEREDWFRVLFQYRDGERLSKIEPQVDAFLAASRARQEAYEKAKRDAAERERESEERARLSLEREREAERQRVVQLREFKAERRQAEADRLRVLAEKERAQAETKQAEAETERAKAVGKRNFWLVVTALIVVFMVLPYALFAIFIQNPVMHGVEKFAVARTLVERREPSKSNPVAGAARRELRVLLDAAALVEEAKSNVAIFDHRWIRRFVDLLPWMGDARRLFAMSTSEPVVNGRLRELLTTALWRSTPDSSTVDKASVFTPVRRGLDCVVTMPSGGPQELTGSLFFDSDAGHGIFVPALGAEDSDIAFYTAWFTGERCASGRRIERSVPGFLKPLILFDSHVRYMAVALSGPSAGPPSVSLYTINWEPVVDGQSPGAEMKFRSVVTDSGAVELVRREVNSTKAKDVKVAAVKSVSEVGGIRMSVAGESWRLFTEEAQWLDSPGAEGDWEKLDPPAAASACKTLGKVLQGKVQPGFISKMFQYGDRCFEIQRGNPKGEGTAAPAPAREQVLVAVYDQPRPDVIPPLSEALPTPIASLVAFGRFMPESGEWVIGKTGDYEGWIALRRRAADGIESHFGAPWSTSALSRLGEQVYALSIAPPASQASAPAKSPAHTPPASSPPHR